MNARALKLYFMAIIWTPGSLGRFKIIFFIGDVTEIFLSETIRIGLIDKRDNLPFQALDDISGYYIDLATTVAQMAGFDHKLIINSSNYDGLGQFPIPVFP